ncbi:MAG: DGQHR domain-containing protein [Deltaproteobacteria bacterium]|nr:DGQHR domain-containing protein [Deltaproteobacteria bacterium]
MLALRMRQKDAEFYFVSYPAEDVLRKVQFISRFYGERGEAVGGETAKEPDDVERFIRAIERSTGAFQRDLNRRKVRQIRDFFRNETGQPLVPGAVLLFTTEELEFHPLRGHDRTGDLDEPKGRFLVIDGQHRLAGLHFYLSEPDAHQRIDIPCVIFDGKTAEFATEMFVIINSTHTRINKSHLIDLYDRIEFGTDEEKKVAADVLKRLYAESDSPLRYHINMLGGRSRQDLWINQAQLFSEVHRLVRRPEMEPFVRDGRGWSRERAYRYLRDLFAAVRRHTDDAWGDNKRYMVTRDVVLKALVRLAGDVAAIWGKELAGRAEPAELLVRRLEPLAGLVHDFRRDGFYERFAARGQVERVDKVRRYLARALKLD